MNDYEDDIETAAAVFAKFARLIDPQIDELHTFKVIRDYIVTDGMHLDNMEELVFLIKETYFNPERDKLH